MRNKGKPVSQFKKTLIFSDKSHENIRYSLTFEKNISQDRYPGLYQVYLLYN